MGTLNLIRVATVIVLALASYGFWQMGQFAEPLVLGAWFLILLGGFIFGGLRPGK